MRLLIARTRITGTLPHFQYQVLIPFDELSAERQDRIFTRSDYGFPGHIYARMADVIAPMPYMKMPFGRANYEAAQRIRKVSERLDAILVNHVHAEMTAERIPTIFAAASDHPPRTTTWVEVDELTATYGRLAMAPRLPTAEELGAKVLTEAQAA